MQRMPVLFIGHGNPMNALDDNVFTRSWATLVDEVPIPRAILVISGHWLTRGVAVTAMEQPRTIHDFGAFPRALFEVQYPAPGSPEIAREIAQALAPASVKMDLTWGLDHGAWSVLVHAYPNAQIPVLQLSIDVTQPLAYHYEMGQRLRALRDCGILIIGSGNVVHNLGAMDWSRPERVFDWAERFQSLVRQSIEDGAEQRKLVDFPKLGLDAQRSIPSADHYLPLLYVLGSRDASDTVAFSTPVCIHGSLSMLSFSFTPTKQRAVAESDAIMA
ncbi:dioxygenase [Lampropedia cohaerens]|uniref:Dioxygenase n=2 Tax=Lampropedia cohaerens TaxID=1610491 RepID=A0A0U1Q0A3_9BURK|nr:dioxygenase [Lampropedia cohaerens]